MELNTQVVDTKINSIQPIIADKSVFTTYSYKLGKPMFLSRTRKVLVDTFIQTRNYTMCQQVVEKECGKKLNVSTIKRLLDYPETQAYIAELFEDNAYFNSWTKEKWYGVMSRHISGKEKLANGDLYAMSLIGKFKGWEQEKGIGTAIQINFTEKSGRE